MEKAVHRNVGESAFRFLRDQNNFIRQTNRTGDTRSFSARLWGKRILCFSGTDVLQLFQSRPAVAEMISADDYPMGLRAILLNELQSTNSQANLSVLLSESWRAYIKKWEKLGRVDFFNEAGQVYLRAALAWLGLPASEREVDLRLRDCRNMLRLGGRGTPVSVPGMASTMRMKAWIGGVLAGILDGSVPVCESSVISQVLKIARRRAIYTDCALLAEELTFTLCDLFGLSVYGTASAVFLYLRPDYSRELRTDFHGFFPFFLKQLRYTYPIEPLLRLKLAENCEWNGIPMKKGTLVLLDLHDGDCCSQPGGLSPLLALSTDCAFYSLSRSRPQFKGWTFLAIEKLKIETARLATNYLTQCMEYDVSSRNVDHSTATRKFPHRLKFTIENVRLKVAQR
jgi:fatty-acid peroxygenase